jgi:hypothetical protein
VIPLEVPVPFVHGGGDHSPYAYFEFTEDVRRRLGDLDPVQVRFALCVDGHVLVRGRTIPGGFKTKDRRKNPLAFENPVLFMRRCEGYHFDVEAVLSVALPFALTVSDGR